MYIHIVVQVSLSLCQGQFSDGVKENQPACTVRLSPVQVSKKHRSF